MNPIDIINQYYTPSSDLHSLLVVHSEQVAKLAVSLGEKLKKDNLFDVDIDFVYEASMLHDIGIFLTDAPGIYCFGKQPYICHGILGRDLLEKHRLMRHALVCERHTGAGITVNDIVKQQLPLPKRDMLPISIEEKIICYSDKFFSKTRPNEMKTLEQARKSLAKFGTDTIERFEQLHEIFKYYINDTKPSLI